MSAGKNKNDFNRFIKCWSDGCMWSLVRLKEPLPGVWVGPVGRYGWHSWHIGLWKEEQDTKQTLINELLVQGDICCLKQVSLWKLGMVNWSWKAYLIYEPSHIKVNIFSAQYMWTLHPHNRWKFLCFTGRTVSPCQEISLSYR